MKFLFAFLFTVASLSGFCQSHLTDFVGKFEVKVGYGAGAMNDLHDVLRDLDGELNLRGEIKQDYAASLNFGATLLFAAKKWDFGVDYTYLRTNGKAQYEDGMEELNFENSLFTHSMGVVAQRRLLQAGPLSAYLSLTVSGYFTDMKVKEFSYIDGEMEDYEFDFRSRSVVTTPMIVTNIKLSRIFYVGAKAGYSFDSKGSVHLMGHEDAELQNKNGDQIYTDWSGFRSEVILAVLF